MKMLMREKTEKILMRARAKISMYAYGNQNASTKGNVEKYRKENYDEFNSVSRE